MPEKENYTKYSKSRSRRPKKEVPVVEEEKKVEEPVEEEVSVEEVTVIAEVIPAKLNVRIEPAKVDGNVIAVITKGKRVTVHKAYENPQWSFISCEVEKGINVDGFVMKGFIKEVKEG